MSATCYFVLVAVLTMLGAAATLLLRPALAYDVREFLGLENRRYQVSHDSFYSVRVAPIFEARCNSCHGVNRQKGNLRLDSFARLMLGGRQGPVVVPGDVDQSELHRLITLPETDEKVMPPEGKKPIKEDEVTVIRMWVAAGASGTQPVEDFKDAPPPPFEVVIPEIDPAAVTAARAPLAATVVALQEQYPGVIEYVSRMSADIQLNATVKGKQFDNATLALLTPINDRIVWADLSGTTITDTSANVIAGMKSLRVLRLRDTQITDTTIKALVTLEKLESLNVLGTDVTSQSLAALGQKNPITIYRDQEKSFE